jgi:adenosine/AMP kinase
VEILAVRIARTDGLTVDVGQSRYITTVEDLRETCARVPGLRFGSAP